ncbi:hypothetical protein [Acanthopleuribacter pedis]|uniref:Uncharacterized protein n=1 Tax=Acanthopleuribacter pedis TaxID=442870 RepID=A0A8J7U3T5_9BACT|nr:hypothetical protein [Acanthopleuribacter pedis]MBO1317601.1 hypothetical protein [Acanthopleuribacter pedis]
MKQDQDEFYVGYQPKAPAGIAGAVRGTVVLLLLLGAVAAFLIVREQKDIAAALFEFGVVREFEGVIAAKPYPMLRVARPDAAGDAEAFSRYLLVAPFKFGADPIVAPFDGKKVSLKGTLIYRDNKTMIELAAEDALREIGGGVGDKPVSFGEVTLKGEIVDSKCFLGVMNPGELKTHKACAVRCISGGIPPVLVVRDGEGTVKTFLLVDRNQGQVNQAVLPMVAEPVAVTGELVRLDDWWMLKADPESYKLL